MDQRQKHMRQFQKMGIIVGSCFLISAMWMYWNDQKLSYVAMVNGLGGIIMIAGAIHGRSKLQ